MTVRVAPTDAAEDWAALARRHFEARRLDEEFAARDHGRPFGHGAVRRALLETMARDILVPATTSGIAEATGARGWPRRVYRGAAVELIEAGLIVVAKPWLIPSAYWRQL